MFEHVILFNYFGNILCYAPYCTSLSQYKISYPILFVRHFAILICPAMARVQTPNPSGTLINGNAPHLSHICPTSPEVGGVGVYIDWKITMDE